MFLKVKGVKSMQLVDSVQWVGLALWTGVYSACCSICYAQEHSEEQTRTEALLEQNAQLELEKQRW